MEKAVVFRNNNIGEYMKTSIISVPGQFVKEGLQNIGIEEGRIIITGNPAHDILVKMRKDSKIVARKELSAIADFKMPKSIIVFCTECIDEIYGEEYFDFLHEKLKCVFDKLPDNYVVIIKLHPREDKKNIEKLYSVFNNHRYILLKSCDTPLLLRSADLVIAHFSAIILEAILVEAPILRINFKLDKKYSDLIPNFDLVVAQNINDFSRKMDKILADPLYRNTSLQLLKEWSHKHSSIQDGQATERVTALIKQIVKSNTR